MKKFAIITLSILAVIITFFLIQPSKSALKSYYSGDAISYNNKIYVATTNSGSLEVFRLDGEELNLIAKVKASNLRFASMDDFFAAKLSIENNQLYVYAVSHYSLYKYRVDAFDIDLVKQITNTYWEWYNQVEKFGNNIATISAKGVSIFNNDLELIVSHSFTNSDAPYNISGNNYYLLSVNESLSAIEVYDLHSRQVINHIPVNFKHENGNRRAYMDIDNNIYVVDDYYTKKFNLSGQLLTHFQHLDFQGFDVNSSGNDYIYFSNGVGVVKLNKDNLGLVDYAWTGSFGPQGAWAMGLKVISNNYKDHLVLFNNTNILILDQNLEKIALVEATEETDLYPSENLFLNLDKVNAVAGSTVLVSGGGFLPHESLTINFNGSYLSTATADNLGRFLQTITTPNLNPGTYDIKVIGDNSALHYSISFNLK